ncbi:MAG: hypothetical protein K2M87_00020 [Muribaculaceae bacterium]|nr:hypothetical protein [Muribaculaceae bacterium]
MKTRLLLFLAALPAIFQMHGADVANATPADSLPEPVGKYIYVPDSLQDDVIRLLKGHSKVVDDADNIDVKERVSFRGDTVPVVLKSLKIGRYDRGLSNLLYVPRGAWQAGLTVSYGELGTKDLDLFGLLSDIDISAYAFQIKPYIQYYIRNNLAVGLKFGYYNARGNLDKLNANIMDDMNFNIHDIMYRAESYSAAMTLTQYIGLSRMSRFGVFNEIELAFQSGNSEFRRPYAGNLRTTYSTSTNVELNFSPGVQVFIMKNVAFHVSFGVFGFYFKNEKQREDDGRTGSRFTSGADFRFNIFNINFGIAVNI